MKRAIPLLVTGIFIGAMLLSGCETNPTDPTLIDSKNVADEAVANSAEIHKTISSTRQISEFLRGSDNIIQVESPDLTPASLSKRAADISSYVLQVYQAEMKKDGRLLSATGDSLIWEFMQRNQMEGYSERVRLYYDFATGKARVELIKFDFDDRHWIKYDSATVKMDLNKTLDDDSDDIIEALEQLKLYKEGQPVVEEWSRILLDPYPPGTEPKGGVADSRITNAPSSFIQETVEHAEIKADSGGLWSKEVRYSDGTKSTEKVTFTADGKGTFEQTGRFGTRVEGTFDSAEEDGVGSFTKLTTLPEGSDPKSIYEAGSFTFNFSDSTLHGTFEKRVEFRDGKVLSESVKIDESWDNGVKVTRLEISASDGGQGIIEIREGLDGDRVTGEWTDPDGTYTRFTINYYPDGSARLEFQVYESRAAYEKGDPPVASGLIHFNPDGSGSGKVTENGEEREVTVGAGGS